LIDLHGRRALVTGGSRGIGAATARLLARAGADVMIGYRSRASAADDVVRDVTECRVRGGSVCADIATREGAERLVSETVGAFGGIDIYVGNAGVWPADDVGVANMSDEQWSRTMRENVDSIFYTCRAVSNVISNEGRIVLVSSTAGQRGEAYHADYAASKGAMISLVKSLAPEMGKRDITVNSVAPGWVDTEMCEQPFANGGRDRIASAIPIGRIATPRDIAGPIVFLCSDLARHITGEIVNVNGGSVLCG
jgi:3-oxoacyl-[acyl-carrier protein] reductase